jgi:hypothetical protein
MACSVVATSLSRDAVQVSMPSSAGSSVETAPRASFGYPCSCTCRTTRSLVKIDPPEPKAMLNRTLLAIPVEYQESPPSLDHGVLAFGLILACGAAFALLTLGGSRRGSRLWQSPDMRAQASSALISASESDAIRAITEVSRRHLFSVAQLLFRRGS